MAWGRENIEWYRELNNYYKKEMLLCAIISLKLLSFFYFCNINSFLIISSACAFSVFISPIQRMGSRAFNSSVTPAASILRVQLFTQAQAAVKVGR